MTITVIKVGGSLSRGHRLTALGWQLAQLGKHHQLLVVPGGGDFADAVRHSEQRYQIDDSTAHWMAILAMDQYGYLLSSQIAGTVLVQNLTAARQAAQSGLIPVLLPFNLLRQTDPLPHSWSVTSDSIAAWVAHRINAKKLILLKSIDGLYSTDPVEAPNAPFLEKISRTKWVECDGVDSYLPVFLKDAPLNVWVINGEQPERLAELLATGQTKGTHIQP